MAGCVPHDPFRQVGINELAEHDFDVIGFKLGHSKVKVGSKRTRTFGEVERLPPVGQNLHPDLELILSHCVPVRIEVILVNDGLVRSVRKQLFNNCCVSFKCRVVKHRSPPLIDLVNPSIPFDSVSQLQEVFGKRDKADPTSRVLRARFEGQCLRQLSWT